MANITHEGVPVHTRGTLPTVGSKAPDFRLTGKDLSTVSLADFKGKRKILNIVVSLDTGVCADSTRAFNSRTAELEDTVVLVVSNDLPWAQKRFCETEKTGTVITLSQLRDREFGKAYGVEMTDGPLAGLLSRAIVVLDENDRVVHTEQVPEITQEPDYDAAIQAAKTGGRMRK